MSSPARIPQPTADLPVNGDSVRTAAILMDSAIAAARPEDLPPIAGELARLSALVSLRILGVAQPVESEDRWLETAEAAQRMGFSVSWLYEHGAEFAFRRKIGGRYRFSEQGLERWKRRGK